MIPGLRRRIPVVKQHDVTDCAAACLHSVAEHAGRRIPIARIRQYASTDRKGTTLLGLVEASERLGFAAKGVRATFESLAHIPLPAIAHVVMKGTLHHYVVVYGVTKNHVLVMDPGEGEARRWTHDEFRATWSGALALLTPRDDFVAGDEETSNARRFWQLVRPHRSVMLQALLAAVAYTLLGLSTSIYVQRIVDSVIVDDNRRLLDSMSVVMIALLVVQLLAGALKNVLTLRTGQAIDGELILGYYKHLLRLPQQFFDTMRVGEIISRVSDAVKIRSFINEVTLELVVNVLIVVFSFSLMFVYSARLALAVLAVVPAYGAIYYLANRRNRQTLRQLMERSADLESQLVESLNSVATIKRFGLERFSNLRTEARFTKLLESVYSAATTNIAAGSASELVSRLFVILLLWIGTSLVLDDALTPGELISCYALIGFLIGPAARLIAMNRTVQDALIASDRLFEIMDLERETSGPRLELTRDGVGDIEFRDVSFRYGTRVQVFRALTLTIAQGQVTAIVGESGSGKSTLLSLAQNLYSLERGQITIGGVDIRQLDNESVRRLVGVVPQQIDLFAGSVIDNVAIGEAEPDVDRVLSLCRRLGISEFVEQMPHGFRTQLGERGATLSGGQRQRLAIARALYRDPEILILDEATSSLDSASEYQVQQVMAELKQRHKTVIVIAHRLSTVMNADRIVVLVRGDVVEDGTHVELLARGGQYARLWEHQFPLPR